MVSHYMTSNTREEQLQSQAHSNNANVLAVCPVQRHIVLLIQQRRQMQNHHHHCSTSHVQRMWNYPHVASKLITSNSRPRTCTRSARKLTFCSFIAKVTYVSIQQKKSKVDKIINIVVIVVYLDDKIGG